MPKLKEIIKVLETLAPCNLAESWDNVGLMVGSREVEVEKVLCALDVNEEVVDEAIKQGAKCIVSHHPFFFAPMKNLNLDSSKGKMIKKLIQNDIAVYSMHTNYDIAKGGLNDYLCELLGLENLEILAVTGSRSFCKVAIYVPVTHLEAVRREIVAVNSCKIGDYKGCTFSSNGEGTFMPLEGSKPFIGTQGVLEKVAENKIEFMAYKDEVSTLMEKIKVVHPYEEVAYDVYDLVHLSEPYGVGRVGCCKEAISFEDFISEIKKVFQIPYVRITEQYQKPIRRVAICSGSGSEYIKVAARKADVYITGDMQFHKGQMAKEMGIPVIDIGHYASENIAMQHISSYLKENLKTLEVVCSNVNGETLMIK
nr:Nif3-like dinuclear metal center hexameric protein [uncultured Cellulosilyticum sp.]